MYEIVLSDSARHQLHKLPRNIQERIISALERIRIRPEAYITRLVGQPFYKFRVGDYRIILNVLHDKLVVLVIEIGHRKNVYK